MDFFVGYSSQSKALRVFNSSTRIIEESDNVKCNVNTPNIPGSGPNWLFDIDSLTNSLNMSDTEAQETSPTFVMFPMPLVDSNDASTTDESHGDDKTESESTEKNDDQPIEESSPSQNLEDIPALEEGPQWDQEPEVNDSNLGVKQKPEGIFINQSKYVASMLQKFGMNDAKPASTPMETHKHLTADVEGEEVDVHHYRSMIGSLMYLTASRPDIMFAVCVCARFQVRPKESHLHAVKRIFKYLKGQPKLGLWYPNDSSFDLVAYTDSDYGGANLDRKSTSGGCQFLGGRLVSWQCKKQTTVSQSTTEAEYIAASQCCSQVLWIQNQMKDYGLSFLQTPIYIDNNSAISIVNNPVKHSKTKHIEIKYHFIRDCNEKKIIQVLKVHTDDQYANQFTKAFDVGRFTFLVTSVGMMNSE
ncbi:hypothetical protein OSB04_002119 [Centaurea solstitialis]|uniref:Uncharacterized protein n=1 Tax=Centaurea solstitialis TaxID=347529 RepID=A0AA38UAX3_9ASTR|nr:hypothetical protein OSB04_002119 [Centaurea solstitialis]